MAKLHPIAAQLGYRTNEAFYRDYPTKESYEMAMGGSPYVGQPTYQQFMSFGPPTKQVPFYQDGGEADDQGPVRSTGLPMEEAAPAAAPNKVVDFGSGNVREGFAKARAMGLPLGSIFRIGGKDYLYEYAKGDQANPYAKKANKDTQRALPVSKAKPKGAPSKAPVSAPTKGAPVQSGFPFKNVAPYDPYNFANQMKQQPGSRKPVVTKQAPISKPTPKSLPKQKVNIKDYGALDFNTSPELAESTNPNVTYKLPDLSKMSPKVKKEQKHNDILMNPNIPADVRETYRRNLLNRDYNQDYVIVSKTNSQRYVFDKNHNLVNVTAVLTGKGKSNRPNTANVNLPLTGANAEAATTPIGRYLLWAPPKKGTADYDYDIKEYGAPSMVMQPLDNQYEWKGIEYPHLGYHGTYKKELQKRTAALRTPTALDNAMSYGCVNEDCSDMLSNQRMMDLSNDTMYVTDPSIKLNMSPLDLIRHEYGGNIKKYLKDISKPFMSKKQEGGEPGKGTSIDDYVKSRSNYVMSYIQGNVMNNLNREVQDELSNEFMRYGGLPKAQGGNQGLKDQAYQLWKEQSEKNMAEEQADVNASDRSREALGEPRPGMSEKTALAATEQTPSGTLKREITEDVLSGEEKANLMLAGISGVANFARSRYDDDEEAFMNRKTLANNVFGTKPGGNRGDWTDGAMFTGSNFRPNQQTPTQFTGQGLYNGMTMAQYGGDQFGGMIQYDTTGSQTLPVALSGLQVKMNPGLGNSTYNSNQLAWPFHPDTMSAPPVRSRRDLTSVPREEANVEAEGGETVVTNFSGDAIPEHYNIKGPRHTNGGVPLSLPEDSFIYSDTAKMRIKDPEILKQFGVSPKKGGVTPAQIAKKYDINKFKKILMDPDSDDVQISTAEKMISDYNLKLAKLALIQESMKGFPQGLPEVAKPYLSQMEIDPSMFFGQEEEQLPESEESPEQEGMETQPDEEMAYGGLPQAKNGNSAYAKNKYFGNFLRGKENEYNERKRQEEYNRYYGNSGSNAKTSDYIPLNYNDEYIIPKIPGSGRKFDYEFSSNDPSVKSPDFLKDTNINSLKVHQRNPSAIGSLFRPRKTTIEIGFGPQGAASKPSTQTSTTPNTANAASNTNASKTTANQANTPYVTTPGTNKILDPNNPTGPYHSQGKKKYYNPQGVGVNESLYNASQDTRIPGFTTPGRSSMDQTYGDYNQSPFNKPFMQPQGRVKDEPAQIPYRNTNTPPYGSYEYGGMYELPMAQVGFTNAMVQQQDPNTVLTTAKDLVNDPILKIGALAAGTYLGAKGAKKLIQKTPIAQTYNKWSKEKGAVKQAIKEGKQLNKNQTVSKTKPLTAAQRKQYEKKYKELKNQPYKYAKRNIWDPTGGKVWEYVKENPKKSFLIGTGAAGIGHSLYKMPDKRAQRQIEAQQEGWVVPDQPEQFAKDTIYNWE